MDKEVKLYFHRNTDIHIIPYKWPTMRQFNYMLARKFLAIIIFRRSELQPTVHE